MAITLDALLAALPSSEFDIYKASQTAEGAGTWHSLWKAAGIPAAGATPPAFGSGGPYVPTRATLGAIGQANPVGSRFLANTNMSASTVGSLIIYDRLWSCSGFGTGVTTAQNVVSGGALPAGRTPVGASDVELWLEVYTAPGNVSAATWTITAPDGGGTNRAFTYAHPANAETGGQMMPVIPPAGAAAGAGVPVSFQASATSGTADIGITLMRRLAVVPFSLANAGQALDAFALGLPEVYDDACLALMVQCSTTNTGVYLGSISLPDLTP